MIRQVRTGPRNDVAIHKHLLNAAKSNKLNVIPISAMFHKFHHPQDPHKPTRTRRWENPLSRPNQRNLSGKAELGPGAWCNHQSTCYEWSALKIRGNISSFMYCENEWQRKAWNWCSAQLLRWYKRCVDEHKSLEVFSWFRPGLGGIFFPSLL